MSFRLSDLHESVLLRDILAA